jgi:hypothetical protein
MANYTKTTDFAAKDTLAGGDTNKVIRGAEFETEFDAIATAVATKSNIAGPTFTGTSTFANLTGTGTINFSGATVSNLGTVTTANLDGGTIDGTVVGGASAAAGSFTTLSASGTLSLGGVAVTSTAAELNILDGVTSTAAELNILDGKSFVDEDDLSSNSATGIPSQQSVKAYVDSQTGLGGATLAGLADTNVTSPADAALLFYDTGTSKWIDNVVSGDITIADTGVAAIGSGVIVNADVNASAAIAVSKTALVAGTGITLSTNTLNVDAAQTQITSVGTLSSLSVSGTLTLGGANITSTAAELNILDGVTSTAAELNILDGVTSTAAELNILDGVTSTAAELNILDGVTSTAAELNILDGVTSTTAELNILDGVTSTAAELNILDGVTSTASELNLVDGSSANTVVNSKAVIYGSSGEVTATQVDITGRGDLRLQDSAGGQYVGLQAPATVSSSFVLSLPAADGSANQMLKTDGSGNLSFTTVASGGLAHLSTVTASGASTVDIETTFDSTYDAYKLIITDLTTSNDGPQITLLMKIGGSYLTAGYHWFLHSDNTEENPAFRYSSGTNSGQTGESYVMFGISNGNDSHANANYEINIHNPADTAIRHMLNYTGTFFEDDNDMHRMRGVANNNTTGALTGLRFAANAGTVSGRFRLYGITKG